MNVSIATVAQDVGATVTGIQTAITMYTLVMVAFMITGARSARSSAASGRSQSILAVVATRRLPEVQPNDPRFAEALVATD